MGEKNVNGRSVYRSGGGGTGGEAAGERRRKSVDEAEEGMEGYRREAKKEGTSRRITWRKQEVEEREIGKGRRKKKLPIQGEANEEYGKT